MTCLGRTRKIRWSDGAFTLLELLVSMTILSLLMVLLLSMVNGATKLWKANENRVDSYREARAAINVIASDLSSLYPSANLSYFATQADSTPKTPVSIEGLDGRLFFVTALSADAQESGKNKSDLCTVGYFLAFDKTSLTGRGVSSYNLYRYFRSSDATFPAIEKGDLLSDITIETSPTSSTSEVLAKNITGFEVVSYEIPPATTANPNPTPKPFVKTANLPMPDMVEITVQAISNEAAKRFSDSKSAWEDKNSITRKQDERVFKTRIYLPGAAQAKAAANASPTPTPTPEP
ncbi:MAG TPA: prepilin-type N-terminal cleavage/methylation domain-containing protein [Chthoniobacterales bacterium]